MSAYAWMDLDDIEEFVPMMRERGVSAVARSRSGFLGAYRRAGGDPAELGDHKSGQPWEERREGFLARHMAQLEDNDEPLWEATGKYVGDPTRRHLALIAWAYTPDPRGVAGWLETME